MANAPMTLAQMQSRVLKNCGNLSTGHPIYVESDSFADYINEALNRVILLAVIDPTQRKRRDNFNMFPELRGRRWTDITVVGQSYLALPDNCLVPDSLTYTKKTSSYSQGVDTEFPINWKDVDHFRLLSNTSNPGWPQIVCREATQLNIWPTPTTAYVTRVVLRGVRAEDDLASASSTPMMRSIWHPAVVAEATSLAMYALGWDDSAATWHQQCEQKIGETVALLGSESRTRRVQIRYAGAPQ